MARSSRKNPKQAAPDKQETQVSKAWEIVNRDARPGTIVAILCLDHDKPLFGWNVLL